MPPTLVSVVIPSYNYARFVTEAVASALAQTYPHREVIVVDDGSTDDTRGVLEPYRDRIRYVHQANQGLSAARNTGIRAAHGEVIALLDADDVWHPRKLEIQIAYLHGHPEVGLVATDLFTDQRPTWPAVDSGGPEPREYSLEELIGRAHFAPSSAVIRKECLETAGLFDPALRAVEDRDLWIRLATRCQLVKLPAPLLWYRVHGQSLSSKAHFMEEHEWRVLHKAFTEVAGLRGKRRLRRQVYSQAAFASAQLFRANDDCWTALRRLLLSWWHWPLPLKVHDSELSFIRIRVLATLVLRLLRLRGPEPPPAVTGAVAPPLPEESAGGSTFQPGGPNGRLSGPQRIPVPAGN
jgi:glycosyltransferase involved in cell wall biosynthesis